MDTNFNCVRAEKPITVEEAILAAKALKDSHENNLVKIINGLIIQNMGNYDDNSSGFGFKDAVYKMVEMGITTRTNSVKTVLDAGSFYIPKIFNEIWDVDDSQILEAGYIVFTPKEKAAE